MVTYRVRSKSLSQVILSDCIENQPPLRIYGGLNV